jgi:anti-sigma regulatory factor (Ser/Thr protein kinase)
MGASAVAVPEARRHTRAVIALGRPPDLAGPAEHVVSELVTNAVIAARELIGRPIGGRWLAGLPPIRLWLTTSRRQMLVQVWDGSGQLPVQQEPELDSGSGRGL